MRCGEPVLRSHYRAPDGQVACKGCRQAVAPPKECSYCGKLARRVVRDSKVGFTKPACEQCRRAHFITCPSCRKYREAAGKDERGRDICATCGKDPQFICPICRQPGIRQSKHWCRRCYEVDYARKRCALAVECIKVPYLRTIFLEFFEHLLASVERPIKLRQHIKLHIEFFQRLEKAAPKPMQLNSEALVQEFDRDGLRLHTRAHNFLLTAGYVQPISFAEESDIAEASARRRLLSTVAPLWQKKALQRFEAAQVAKRETYKRKRWTGEDERFRARTITLHLRAAKRFLEHLPPEISSLEAIAQEHLDRFIWAKPGHRNALHAFITYLQEKGKTFAKLHIDRSNAPGAPMHRLLTPLKSMELTRKWLNPADRDVKKSLILLFMLLYGQDVTRTVGLKWSQFVRGPDNLWRARFAETWVPLDERFGALLDRYAQSHRHDDSPGLQRDFLFPGRRADSHLSAETVRTYLVSEGLRAEHLFTTCIINAYRNGVRLPKTLVKALGISDETAVRYFQQIDSKAAKTYARRNAEP